VGFFNKLKHMKLDGQKELTINKDVVDYTRPKKIAIPIKHLALEDFTVHVKEGDYVKIGTKLATGNDHIKLPLFSSVSGTVATTEKRDHVSLRKSSHIIIENDFKDEKELLFEPKEDSLLFSDTEIKDHMKNAGILGLGGSGTPTFTKFRNTKNVTSILINGVEDEPFISADEYNMGKFPELLIKGAVTLMKAADAEECVIVVKKSKKAIYEEILLFSKEYRGVKVITVPDIYPMGSERSLIKRIWGKTYKTIPIEAGVISLNVSTVIEAARTFASGLPLYERVITLAGNGFAQSTNVKVRVGTILSDVISEIGGYATDLPKTARLIHGGPMMGTPIITDDLSVTSASNGFVCIVGNDEPEAPCSRCGACTNHCPQGLQPMQIARYFKLKDKTALKSLGAGNCIECGLCSFVCPSFINVADSCKKGKVLALQK